MMKSEQNCNAIAHIFLIVGAVIFALAVINLLGWLICDVLKIINFDFEWKWGKLIFCCGLGIYGSGEILSKMTPGQEKSNHKRAMIGIAFLLACSIISVTFIITRFTTYVIVPLTIGMIGNYIGSKNDDVQDVQETDS